ncbi:Hypothetical predicted protein [Mytilus galloprovincialis]|uniref:B box-type domain-containing protein n=1 Tax=Mytilus galloprovincialis TaxID=29158 RepID=A0A8B6EQQ9_MYTGA|nr:Hypothetical predicted protein [Mytilus galloprovincialis]
MADNMLEREIKTEISKSSKQLRCRYHETEEYTIFCKDCKDVMCYKCIGQLHQKHDLCQLQDAEEDIRKEMEVLLLNGKYSEQLTALGDKLSDTQTKLLEDEERLNCEIKTSVKTTKEAINFTEERLLTEIRNTFESYQITLRRQVTNVKDLQKEITNLEVNKLNEYEFSQIINILSEINLCSSKCDKIATQPIPGFKRNMEFSFGNLIETPSAKSDAHVMSLSAFCDISTQTDFLEFNEDSETEWFDAEDFVEDDSIESSSDEVTDKYPTSFQLKQDITLVKKIVSISETDAWILAHGKLLKIVNNSLDDIVYANKVIDFVVLKDACVLILSEENSFIMKLLSDRRQVRFANIGSHSRTPHCFCITADDLLVVYLISYFGKPWYEYKNYIIWMDIDGIVRDKASFSRNTFQKPCNIQILESYICVLYCKGVRSNLHCIELLEKKMDTYNSIKSFSGIYGLDAWDHFQSHGMCVNKADNVIISDFRHHSVYMVDKDLKYKKTLLDAKNGLDKPAAIEILNDHIWIADGNRIFIFNFAYIHDEVVASITL